MNQLCDLQCEVCRKGAPAVTDTELKDLLPQVPEWDILSGGGTKRLTRIFKFKNFADALDFTNKVGVLAEETGHHPSILTEWGSVTVTYWTHKINGLHKTDFIMAAKTDKLYGDT